MTQPLRLAQTQRFVGTQLFRRNVGYCTDRYASSWWDTSCLQSRGVFKMRFYFHLKQDAKLLIDEEGTDLRDMNAAADEALKSAR
jgi:hypothetical protein